MALTNNVTPNHLARAVGAIGNLTVQGLNVVFSSGQSAALAVQSEIEVRPVVQRRAVFYQQFVRLRSDIVAILAESYRRYLKLALAHPREVGNQSEQWAWAQLQPAVGAVLEWIRDWFILACDGENQYVRRAGSTEFVPGQTVSLSIPTAAPPFPSSESWRAPAWLFGISLALFGVGLLKTKHVPATDSEQKLGSAHTRLLLKGARRVFLWELGAAIETVWNEEIAAAGAIPAETVNRHTRRPNKRKGWERRLKLYSSIQKVLNDRRELQGMEFCAELDKRHAPPLLDWIERGDWREGLTWKEAWSNPDLRRKIRRVRQEAMKDR